MNEFPKAVMDVTRPISKQFIRPEVSIDAGRGCSVPLIETDSTDSTLISQF